VECVSGFEDALVGRAVAESVVVSIFAEAVLEGSVGARDRFEGRNDIAGGVLVRVVAVTLRSKTGRDGRDPVTAIVDPNSVAESKSKGSRGSTRPVWLSFAALVRAVSASARTRAKSGSSPLLASRSSRGGAEVAWACWLYWLCWL